MSDEQDGARRSRAAAFMLDGEPLPGSTESGVGAATYSFSTALSADIQLSSTYLAQPTAVEVAHVFCAAGAGGAEHLTLLPLSAGRDRERTLLLDHYAYLRARMADAGFGDLTVELP